MRSSLSPLSYAEIPRADPPTERHFSSQDNPHTHQGVDDVPVDNLAAARGGEGPIVGEEVLLVAGVVLNGAAVQRLGVTVVVEKVRRCLGTMLSSAAAARSGKVRAGDESGNVEIGVALVQLASVRHLVHFGKEASDVPVISRVGIGHAFLRP